MKRPLVSVIIVNWNGKPFLRDCLTSLMKVFYKNIEILLVDNASTDGSVEYVKKHFPFVHSIQNTENLGFAGGHDVALKKAKGEAILLLNTDTIVEKNLIGELVRVLYRRENIGVVQPKLLLFPQQNLIDSVGSFFLTNGLLYHYGREKLHTLPSYNREMEIFSAKGVCMLLRREVIEKVGLFDQDFFAYFEETDLCLRIWLAGYSVVYTPATSVYHIGGASSKQSDPLFIQYHSCKNAICSYMKNLSFPYLTRVLPRLMLLYELASAFYFLSGRIGDAFAPQKAIWWNIVHLKETVRKRNHIQHKIRAVQDDDFLPKLTKRVRLSYYYYKVFGGMGKYRDVG